MDSFLPSSNFCHLLITFANSLDLDQDRQNVVPDLDPNHLTNTLIVFLKDFLEKIDFHRKSADDNKSIKITQHAKSLIKLGQGHKL